MWQARELARAFLSAVKEGCGATDASVFIPTWPGMKEAILVHSGEEATVPELQDVDAAFAFARAHAEAAAISAETPTVPSVAAGGTLLPIPLVTSLWQVGNQTTPPREGANPKRRVADQRPPATTLGWVALRLPTSGPAGDSAAARPTGLAIGRPALDLANRLASLYLRLYGSLTDPLTGLPGRSALRTSLRQELATARAERHAFSLVFINPDDFGQVNVSHGRNLGDLVLRELVVRAGRTLRRSDVLYRYGSAIFAVMLPNTGYEVASIVADKLRSILSGSPYLGGQIALTFSAGIASVSAGELAPVDPIDFIGRAESALASAKRVEGGGTVVWRAGAPNGLEPLDRLRHAFTGDQDRDYRNMGLLWDAVGLLATTSSPSELARRVVSQLRRALSAALVGLFEPRDRGLELTFGLARSTPTAPEEEVEPQMLTADQRHAVATAEETRLPAWTAEPIDDGSGTATCAVPLLVDNRLVGVLLLAGLTDHMTFDESDLTFMRGFAGPLALAMDRASLAERKRQQEDAEKRRLVGELKDLRTALRQARLVYVSQKMEDLVLTARRVADTDATILITGESGTGKEMLAHTIHQLGARRNRPLVIVDCGAIPSTLIESELFGHERGAFTGALTRSVGRIGQADGGTVLLDEIGELPLEVQSKLLRFVQEKQFMSVGSTQVRRVDVRVLAATNRNLAREVDEGRFRGDLYHRLNVISLSIPPLRERPDDVLELAKHFLEVFATKYQKPVRSLGHEVEDALMRHAWPGNIRELQNRIMRAVLLSDGDRLTVDALELPATRAESSAGLALASEAGPRESTGTPQPTSPRAASAGPSGTQGDAKTAWSGLRDALQTVVVAQLASRARVHPPLGRWLDQDLVLAAFEQADGVARRAASALGLPETTFMRRLRRAQSDAHLVRRPPEWDAVAQALGEVLHHGAEGEQDLLTIAELHLLEIIDAHLHGNANAGASLLGTSLPTFRRRLESLKVAS